MTESYLIQSDGYTLWGRIQRWPGLYPEAIFKYRPATSELSRRLSEAFGAERDAYARKLVVERIDGLRQAHGDEPTKFRQEDLVNMHASLFNQLLNHVVGSAGPDVELMEKNSVPPSASG